MLELKLLEQKILEHKILEQKMLEQKMLEQKMLEQKMLEQKILKLKALEIKSHHPPTVDKMTVDKMSVDKMTIDEMTRCHLICLKWVWHVIWWDNTFKLLFPKKVGTFFKTFQYLKSNLWWQCLKASGLDWNILITFVIRHPSLKIIARTFENSIQVPNVKKITSTINECS